MRWVRLHVSPSNVNYYEPFTDRWENNRENCDTHYWTDSGQNYICAMYPWLDPNDLDQVRFNSFEKLGFRDADDFVDWMLENQ